MPVGWAANQRGEGVALVLSAPVVEVWNAGGSSWEAWSSKLVAFSMKIGRGRMDVLHVLPYYAPT